MLRNLEAKQEALQQKAPDLLEEQKKKILSVLLNGITTRGKVRVHEMSFSKKLHSFKNQDEQINYLDGLSSKIETLNPTEKRDFCKILGNLYIKLGNISKKKALGAIGYCYEKAIEIYKNILSQEEIKEIILELADRLLIIKNNLCDAINFYKKAGLDGNSLNERIGDVILKNKKSTRSDYFNAAISYEKADLNDKAKKAWEITADKAAQERDFGNAAIFYEKAGLASKSKKMQEKTQEINK